MSSISLAINKELCIKCSKCVKVCPADILVQREKLGEIEIVNLENCIICGHCVASCPEDAVIHSVFPEDKVHNIDYNVLPNSEQLMLLMKARRSNRAFSKKTIPDQSLKMILEAAHRAPTGSNSQQVKFLVITNPEVIHTVIDFTANVFFGMLKKLKNPLLRPIIKLSMPDAFRYIPVIEKMKSDYENGADMILRKAPSLILIYTPKKMRMGYMDANLAYQNGSLMAESLGVSQFYLGFVLNAINMKKGKLESLLGIDGEITAGMGLGMPAFQFPKYIDKKEIEVLTL